MPSIGNLSAKITADPREFVSAMDKVKKKLKETKDAFGEESAIGGIFKALRGAGALAGIALAANALEGVTKGLLEIRRQSEETEFNLADWASAIGKSLPILGSIVRAGENISDLFTDSKKTAAGLEATLKANDALYKIGEERLAAQAAAAKKLLEEQKRIAESVHDAEVFRRERVFGFFSGAQDQINQLLFGSVAAELEQARGAGASVAELASLRVKLEQLDAIKAKIEADKEAEKVSIAAAKAEESRFAGLESAAQSLFQSTRTPLELVLQQLTEISDLFAEGAIGADKFAEVFRRLSVERAALEAGDVKAAAPAQGVRIQLGPRVAAGIESAQSIFGGQLDKTNALLKKILDKVDPGVHVE